MLRQCYIYASRLKGCSFVCKDTSFIHASPYSVVFPTNMELPRRMFSSDVNTLVSAGVSVDEETNTLVLSNRMYLPLLPLLSRQVP